MAGRDSERCGRAKRVAACRRQLVELAITPGAGEAEGTRPSYSIYEGFVG
jgi:hypothetical protein